MLSAKRRLFHLSVNELTEAIPLNTLCSLVNNHAINTAHSNIQATGSQLEKPINWPLASQLTITA